MTNAPGDPPSRLTSLVPDPAALDEEARRAWVDRMAVRSLGSGRYAVEDRDGTAHVVALDRGECTCPDHDASASCRHVRRVAIEVDLGRVPPPDRAGRCRACDTPTTPGEHPPTLCDECLLGPGDVVLDRERSSASPLLVLSVTDRRADEVTVPDADRTLAEYGANRRYDLSDPVVEAVYPHSVRTDRPPRTYSFPISRLERPGDDADTVQTTLPEITSEE